MKIQGTILWRDSQFLVVTPTNPHLPAKEGLHVVVIPHRAPKNAWQNPELCAVAFGLAARICQVMEALEFAPWFNLQANGNWGLLPGGTPFFHVHILARRKGKTWGRPVKLPKAPGTFHHRPMLKAERVQLAEALRRSL